MAGQWVLGSQHRAIDGLGIGTSGRWGMGSQSNATAGWVGVMAKANKDGRSSAAGGLGGGSVAF